MTEKRRNPPVHEIIIEKLNGRNVLESTVVEYADLYGGGKARCPADGIPELIAAFGRFAELPRLRVRVSLAINNLKAQLKIVPAESC